MPQRDIIHDAVRASLIKAGWTITHDPFYLQLGEKYGFIDLAAEQPIAAEKSGQKIAVEIKSFIGKSVMSDLEQAIGQYQLYAFLLTEVEPDRTLHLAISEPVFANVFNTKTGLLLLQKLAINLLIISLPRQEIVQWIP